MTEYFKEQTEFEARQLAEKEGERLELEGCAAEHKDEAMSEYEELKNQLTIAMIQCHEAKLGEAHDTDFYVDTILPIIAERCVVVDKSADFAWRGKNLVRRHGYDAFTSDGVALVFVNNGWRPVKKLKQEAR